MKFLTQVVLPILLVVALIGGVTFVSQYGGTGKKPVIAKVAIEEDPLSFDARLTDGNVTTVQWDDQAPGCFAEFEVHSKGHYDFLFGTRGDAPVEVSLKYKNCACANARIALLTQAETSNIAGHAGGAVGKAAGGFSGVLGSIPALIGWAEVLDTAGRWQTLEEVPGKTVTVPPTSSGMPAMGVVRVNWEGRRLGREGLLVELWVQQRPKGRSVKRLRVPLNFVPAIQVVDRSLTVPDLTARSQEQRVEFKCWSSTRTSFPLTVKEESGSPCFICEAKPLSRKEREKLVIENRERLLRELNPPTSEDREKLRKELTGRVLSGYRVTVTISERQGDRLLDLGPYRRRLLLQAGPAESESAIVMLEGMVRGEVAFLNPADKDRINLGDFPANQGGSKMVPLVTEQDGQPLEVDSWAPALLSVKLAPAGGKRWDLTVEVPANRQRGWLPNDSAVVVRTKGTAARRMRIPVVGQATTR